MSEEKAVMKILPWIIVVVVGLILPCFGGQEEWQSRFFSFPYGPARRLDKPVLILIRQDFENLRSADTAGEFTADFDRFETAMAEFEEGLTSLLSGEGGILSGIFGLAEGAAELAIAGDILDEAIDCPGE